MVFSSAIFLLVFLPATFIINYIFRNKTAISNLVLLIASLLFYAWGEPVLVLLMILSIIINWGVGRIIDSSDGLLKNVALIIGVVLDLGILGYYKYAGLIVQLINGLARKEVLVDPKIALPIGISFFTFQAISYIVDVYRKDTDAAPHLINTALYIAFFPQLIAGPIVKYRDINKQIESRTITFDGVSAGFRRFIYGLSKKVLISNVLGLCVDTIFSYDISLIDTKMAWIGILAYTFQIYYDFSGYSDMAIGLGKMFGFDILENFNYPYLSRSISEYWRRWHISLGSWFREYVYIPLGGNRKGTVRTYVNLFLVFLLTGLWHGASVSYILWGIYHGVFSIIERLGLGKILKKLNFVSTIYAFLVVVFGFVIFRANNVGLAIAYMGKMVNPWKYGVATIESFNYMSGKTVFMGICAFVGAGILKKYVPENIANKWKDSVVEAIYLVLLLILCLASIASDTYNPFIYFQF